MKQQIFTVVVTGACLCGRAWAVAPDAASAMMYIDTCFENASPLWWDVAEDGSIHLNLVYDHERGTTNRANGHWYFRVEAQEGSELTLFLRNFENVWNGRKGSPISARTNCYVSTDGRQWSIVPAEKTDDNCVKVRIAMKSDSVFVARMEPYTAGDLERFLAEVKDHPLVEITQIGKTVEGRPLEIIRVGRPDARFRVLIRARAHPWEAGGNWVVDGLIKSLLKDDEDSRRFLECCCLYVMPMANKDGVVRGRTRFNLMGMDLNRNWGQSADVRLAPENHALESWLEKMIAAGRKPDLAFDLHNDNNGRIHISRPEPEIPGHLARMERVEQLLRKHTWFTEGATGATFRNPGTFGEGLLMRYGICAFVYELNCDWIAGLNKAPTAADWQLLGRQLRKVFSDYFAASGE
ncbi:MAG: succinylglutamate desuccinylase/aspartoacylase family protein [Phycisphaerae bacterium]|nr:succinylglutamate desuccinylase/aspartoacylase family protein [Phycisphaerae bacterium]